MIWLAHWLTSKSGRHQKMRLRWSNKNKQLRTASDSLYHMMIGCGGTFFLVRVGFFSICSSWLTYFPPVTGVLSVDWPTSLSSHRWLVTTKKRAQCAMKLHLTAHDCTRQFISYDDGMGCHETFIFTTDAASVQLCGSQRRAMELCSFAWYVCVQSQWDVYRKWFHMCHRVSLAFLPFLCTKWPPSPSVIVGLAVTSSFRISAELWSWCGVLTSVYEVMVADFGT